jgi:hypothetical protein
MKDPDDYDGPCMHCEGAVEQKGHALCDKCAAAQLERIKRKIAILCNVTPLEEQTPEEVSWHLRMTATFAEGEPV